jgi:hypothetical protein
VSLSWGWFAEHCSQPYARQQSVTIIIEGMIEIFLKTKAAAKLELSFNKPTSVPFIKRGSTVVEPSAHGTSIEGLILAARKKIKKSQD